MNKKFKFASAFLSAGLLITPVSGLVNQYDNVAKANESFNIPIDINNDLTEMYDGWAGTNGVIATDYFTTRKCVEYITDNEVSNYSAAASFGSYLFKGLKSVGISIVTAFLPNFHGELWYKCKEAASQGKGVFIRYVGVKTWDGHATLRYPIYTIM